MDRIWQWAWDRYGPRYSWAISAVTFLVLLSIYLVPAIVVVAREGSGHYVEAAAVTVVAVLVLVYVMLLPGLGRIRLAERWAAGHTVDRAKALGSTYTYVRGTRVRAVPVMAAVMAVLLIVVAGIAGAPGWRLVPYGTFGGCLGIAVALIGAHSFGQAAIRPARLALVGDKGIGDSLPRARPTFAAWSNVSM